MCGDTEARAHVWTSSVSVFAPSFTPLPSTQGPSAVFSPLPASYQGKARQGHTCLHSDTDRGSLKCKQRTRSTKWGRRAANIWPGLFFFHWWSRLVYGRWNKVRADGRSVHREFIWVVLKSNKKLVKKRKELRFVLQSPVITSSTKNWQNGFFKDLCCIWLIRREQWVVQK